MATSVSHRVLVVEDHVDSAEVLAAYLRALGHEVAVAGDAEAALEIARALTPSVVILDIGLPTMDGIELARLLRTSLGPTARLFAASALSDDGVRARARDAGIEHYFVKPLPLAVLAAKLG